MSLDQRTGTGEHQRREAIRRPWEDTACFWGEFEDLRTSLREVAEDLSQSREARLSEIRATHQSFCRTLNLRLAPLQDQLERVEAESQNRPTSFPPPRLDDIRKEVREAMATMERYAFNSKPGQERWHRLPHYFGVETPGALQAYCGWRCGISHHAEVHYTLGVGKRCRTCFGKPDDAQDKPIAGDTEGDN